MVSFVELQRLHAHGQPRGGTATAAVAKATVGGATGACEIKPSNPVLFGCVGKAYVVDRINFAASAAPVARVGTTALTAVPAPGVALRSQEGPSGSSSGGSRSKSGSHANNTATGCGGGSSVTDSARKCSTQEVRS